MVAAAITIAELGASCRRHVLCRYMCTVTFPRRLLNVEGAEGGGSLDSLPPLRFLVPRDIEQTFSSKKEGNRDKPNFYF